MSVLGFGKQVPVRASPTLYPEASLMARQSREYLDSHLIKQEKIREQGDFAESYTCLGWRGLLRSSSLAYDLTPPCQLHHGTKCHIQSFP